MRAAVTNDVPEIVAECGGAAACATCHVYVDPRPGLPPRSAIEDDMLEMTAEPRQANSRLGCQIFMTADLDGIEVHLPETQV
jgi:2Fe-2S ferredoxin